MKTPHRINSIRNPLHGLSLFGSPARIASSLAALALASTASHAAPTVWNVNIGTQITTSDDFAGAAPENTVANSFWNSAPTSATTAMALADATGSSSEGVTLTLAGSLAGGTRAITGPEIFATFTKAPDNATPFPMTIGGLSTGVTYDLVVYSDWFWKGNVTFPVTQTVGSGLIGTFTLDQISTGTNGTVPGLVEDTDLSANGAVEGNWIRITGLTPDSNGDLGFSMGGTNAAFSGFQLVQIDLEDTTPPNPSPMTWEKVPVSTGESSITMTATTATDPSGVEYLFTETSGNPGGTSSSWQTSPTFTDTDLTPGTTYTYTVTARDTSPAQNQTTPSTEAAVTTNPVDNTPPAIPGFDIEPLAISTTQITMTATTVSDDNGVEYYFTETSGNPGGSDSGWQDSPSYIDGGLDPATSYTYMVKARDKSIAQNPSPDSATTSTTTATEAIVSRIWNVNFGTQITPSDDFTGAAFENTVQDSFWNSVMFDYDALPLADATESFSAGVTLTLAGSISTGTRALTSGPEIFSSFKKSPDNATPFTMTIGGAQFQQNL